MNRSNGFVVDTDSAPDDIAAGSHLYQDGVFVAFDVDADAAAKVRKRRNELLEATDYLALTDTVMSDEMVQYRQALRDITSQDGFPHRVDWPVKP